MEDGKNIQHPMGGGELPIADCRLPILGTNAIDDLPACVALRRGKRFTIYAGGRLSGHRCGITTQGELGSPSRLPFSGNGFNKRKRRERSGFALFPSFASVQEWLLCCLKRLRSRQKITFTT
jgi:hypothetical protein